MKKLKPTKDWWRFTGVDGSFIASDPHRLSRLYFPLCNEAGLLSSITPDLNGDIKTGQNCFVTLPVSPEDLHNSRAARRFWIHVKGQEPWSVASGFWNQKPLRSTLRAGFLWHELTIPNPALGLEATILSTVPATDDAVELMRVTLTNTSTKPVRFIPTAAIPLFARSADNLRDHRHVTSLLHRITLEPNGLLVKPTMSFDERGHRINERIYAVFGTDGSGKPPVGLFPTVTSFIGEGGSFDRPQAVWVDEAPPKLSEMQLQGREAIGALRFAPQMLKPKQSVSYILMIGVANDAGALVSLPVRYGKTELVEEALEKTKTYWSDRLSPMSVKTVDPAYDQWVKWVTIQPILRKIYGCSFLPDFDYGRGGRGWRDLWQDCLALMLMQPAATRELLINNFAGIRMNGSNATIIGKNPGEFIADRNNISRVWMDHGVWPWITTELYIQQSGDFELLFTPAAYFWDQDKALSPQAENGTIFEHILVQHLTSYFNVGDHGNIRLEDADWNDGMDMAHERGESVAFTAVYAGNLLRLSALLRKLQDEQKLSQVELAEELLVLLERHDPSVNQSPEQKRARLKLYREKTAQGVSGRKGTLSVEALAGDLERKGQSLAAQVRDNEWIRASGKEWFNGYYDNMGQRVEGDHALGVRMTLTGQVFPIMSGVATDEQIQKSFNAAKTFLQDKQLKGFRLNTNFGEIQPNLGRAFSFAYGEKENGAFFSHMIVMFANALYQRNFVEEGFEVLNSLYAMCRNSATGKVYPCMPEYFNSEGRGLYTYLTGSASWYLLTLVTQVLGIRGEWGDLLLAPKLLPEQFDKNGNIQARVLFGSKTLNVTYHNPRRKIYGSFRIKSVEIEGQTLPPGPSLSTTYKIPRLLLDAISNPEIKINVLLD